MLRHQNLYFYGKKRKKRKTYEEKIREFTELKPGDYST